MKLQAAPPTSHARGLAAEALAAGLLQSDGYEILGTRVRTEAGEIDLIAAKDALLTFVEVKTRATLADAAEALSIRQRERLLGAAEAWLAQDPSSGKAGIRFDVIVIDRKGCARRIRDAFRLGD